MTVVHLKDWRRLPRKSLAGRPTPQAPVEPPAMHTHVSASEADDRYRMLQNFAAFLVVVAIVVFGGWLIDRLQTYARVQACIDFGHRNCVPLDIGHLSPRQLR